VTDRRLALGVLGLLLFGWALVAAAEARVEPPKPALVYTEVLVRTVEVEPVEVETPIADALVDWVEFERQTDCLWTLLQEAGVDITFEIVVAAGTWTDALGGACLVIGVDDGLGDE
jgi:hypothetical protein